jgi:peptidyl-prolyl isomerase E (cyclophilin E)
MANEKNTIYVGGLADDVNEKLLHDIFIVFGDISEIQVRNFCRQTIGNADVSKTQNLIKFQLF